MNIFALSDNPTQAAQWHTDLEDEPTRIEQQDYPCLTPSLLFTEEEVNSVDWDKVFEEW